MSEGLWLIDTETGEPTLFSWADIDAEVMPQLLKPVKGSGFCYEAERFRLLPLPDVPFYIRDWLPKEGKALLYGPGKVGKSMLALQAARCIASGLLLLGIPTAQGRVLLLQFELGASVFQKRINDTGQDYGGVYVGTTFGMKLDTAGGQEQMTRALSAIEPNVVILDPFYKLLRGEEDESHDVLLILDFLDTLIESFGCSFLIVHHSGKDVSRGGRGSSVLVEDWPDSVIEMRRTKQTDDILRCKVKPKFLRHAALPPEALEIELVDYEFALGTGELDIAGRIQQYAAQKGQGGMFSKVQLSVAELVKAGLGSERGCYVALNKMIETGTVSKAERGVYLCHIKEVKDDKARNRA